MKAQRSDFPIFKDLFNGFPLIYFDSAATVQKPQVMIDAMVNFYTKAYASVGRGVYPLAEHVTERYEQARRVAAQFINARDHEIIFTSGGTHGLNLIAHAWGNAQLKKGDEILLTELEHHSTILPWQDVAAMRGATIRYLPVLPDGTLDISALDTLVTKKTKLISFSHVSNLFGSMANVARIVQAARRVGARVVLDAAQSAGYYPIDVRALDVDFLVFSGHKLGGPTGIGVLYMHQRVHDEVPPFHRGGGMVYEADYHGATWRKPPHRYEAGTPPIAQAIGLQAAIEYINAHINMDELKKLDAELCSQLIDGLKLFPRVKIFGPQAELRKEGHLVSFTIDGIHPHDVATYCGAKGICVRAGHLCAQPLAKKMGISGVVRASFYVYNTPSEVARFLQVIEELLTVM